MFEIIRQNQRRSALVIASMGALLVLTGMAFGASLFGTPLIGGVLALGLWGGMWLLTIQKGDEILLAMAGAKQIEKEDHPQLVNVVEEMTIASSLKQRPSIYIVDDPSPNAFAAGRRVDKSAVAVTTGLLATLNRHELQGVIAHEIAHIKNRDVSLMTTAGIMMGSIVLLTELGLRVLWFSPHRASRDSKSSGLPIPLWILSLVFMILAPVFSQLIYFSLSRRREYLADASAAQLTRYPEGLASALEKLSGSTQVRDHTSRVIAPMFIVAPKPRTRNLDGHAEDFLSTHPPLTKRIEILRKMSGGSGLKSYERAYREVAGHGVIPKGSLALGSDSPIEIPETEPADRPHQRAREASDAFLMAAGYRRQACGLCGVVLKIPPSLGHRLNRCPRCRAKL